jgi:hypothetical protein
MADSISRHIDMYDSLPDSDAVLAQFNRLIQELLRGNMHRNTFRPWEIELLLDIETCNLRESAKRETLKRYQKAVQRHMEKGARLPLKLSEYLDNVKAKRTAQGASAIESVSPQSV